MKREQTLFLVPNNVSAHPDIKNFLDNLLEPIQATFPISYIATGGTKITRLHWLMDLGYKQPKWNPESMMENFNDPHLDLSALIRKLMSNTKPESTCRTGTIDNLIIISDCKSISGLSSCEQSWLSARNVMLVTENREAAEALLKPQQFPTLHPKEIKKLQSIKIMDHGTFQLWMQMCQLSSANNEYSFLFEIA